MKIKLQAREIMLLALAVCAAIGYGFYTLWFLDYDKRIQDTKTEITSNEAAYDSAKKLVAKLPVYTAKKDEIEAQATKLAAQLPTVDALPSVLQDLKAVLESNGVLIKSISLDKNSVKQGLPPDVDAKTAKISFSGSYPQVVDALKSLETNTQRTYTIGDLSMNKETSTIGGNLSVNIFFAKAPVPGFEYKPMLEPNGKADIFAQ